MSIPTILLIGDKGFLGSHLKARLPKEYPDVNILTLYRDHLYRTLGSDQFSYVDVIINCAAELTDESKMFESNVILPHLLLEFMRRNGIKKMIQVGSSSEYGVTEQQRRESDLCVPTNIYEATKLAATNLCIGYANRYDLDVCVARPFSLFGPNDKSRKLIPTLYRSYIEDKTTNIYPHSGHDWIHVDDFLDGIITLVRADKSLTKGDIVNLGTGVSSSNRQLVAAIEAALGASLSINWTKDKYHPYDVENWQADISKAWIKYGWKPKYNLKNGVASYVMAEWFAEDKG